MYLLNFLLAFDLKMRMEGVTYENAKDCFLKFVLLWSN